MNQAKGNPPPAAWLLIWRAKAGMSASDKNPTESRNEVISAPASEDDYYKLLSSWPPHVAQRVLAVDEGAHLADQRLALSIADLDFRAETQPSLVALFEENLLKKFDLIAEALLEGVRGRTDLAKYSRSLKSWCDEVLPALEKKHMSAFVVGAADLQRLQEGMTTRYSDWHGHMIGTASREKLAAAIHHLKAKAAAKVRAGVAETGEPAVEPSSLESQSSIDSGRITDPKDTAGDGLSRQPVLDPATHLPAHLLPEHQRRQAVSAAITGAWERAKSTVNDAGQWKNFNSELKRLNLDGLAIIGHSIDGWRLHKGTERAWLEFRELAIRCGRALRCPSDVDPANYWLQCLIAYFREKGPQTGFISFMSDGGEIRDVFEANSEFLLWLANEASRVAEPTGERSSPSNESGSREKPTPASSESGTPQRFPSTITSAAAVARMNDYIQSKGLGLTAFASMAGTTDRTLRSFRNTGRVRRDVFNGIAMAMGTTPEELMKPEKTSN